MAVAMRHLIILLPGIMGSVLEKQGTGQVWGLSGQALWTYLRSLGGALQSLRVPQDDWQQDSLGDGITATGIIQDMHAVPFVIEHAGYSTILGRLPEHFDVTTGSIAAPRDDANFFPFPYDWRRDNRVTARKLKTFVDKQLPRWRAWSGASDAQVILIGHSLGGLVARHYVEALGGWQDCLALLTVGSPHRGAIGALEALSNGVHKAFIDLSDIVRSFESAHQILPTYAAVKAGGQFVRPAEAGIPTLDSARAAAARDNFLDATRATALANRTSAGYRQTTLPWVGTRQDTLQSASVVAGKVVVSYDPPAGLDLTLADGDGTVPRVSAVPSELDGQRLERFAVERHGWLTNNAMTLDPLLQTLTQIAAAGTGNLYGAAESRQVGLGLRVEPVYTADEPVVVSARLKPASDQAPAAADQPRTIRVRVEPVGHATRSMSQTVSLSMAEARPVVFEHLPAGLYQVAAEPETAGPGGPAAVHGLFEVVESSANP
jgi:pimeloyl-ACP methyl ester carboxylesterase